MHALAQCSAASTSRPQRMSSSCPSSGRCSGATSIRTWLSEASLSSPISWRSSATIATSPTLGRSALASSSISAGVAPRPAKTPKFTRNSTPGGSTYRTQNAICGSTLITSRIAARRRNLTLARLPAEIAQRDDHAGEAPGGDHGHVRALRPDRLVVQHHVADQPQEVRQRQHVGDRAQELREVLGREECARDEG